MPSSARVFRHQLSSEVLARVRPFAEANADLPGRQFRAQWDGWIVANRTLLDTEATRLAANGYAGDVDAKVYRSARYYFKSRPPTLERKTRATNSTPYLSIAPQLISSMDGHIAAALRSTQHAKPAELFATFMLNLEAAGLTALLASELARFMEHGGLDATAAERKLKKTYKNRYFRVSRMLGSPART